MWATWLVAIHVVPSSQSNRYKAKRRKGYTVRERLRVMRSKFTARLDEVGTYFVYVSCCAAAGPCVRRADPSRKRRGTPELVSRCIQIEIRPELAPLPGGEGRVWP